jgi:hypothetical protein
MNDILGTVQHYWPWIAGIGGTAAAIAVFTRELLTITKLRHENLALKKQAQQNQNTSSFIKIPSDAEVYRYGSRKDGWNGGAVSTPGWLIRTLLALAIVAGALAALGYPAWRFAAGVLVAVIIYFVILNLLFLFFAYVRRA